eukprot:6557160-Heterocapsa_arctica.AAC.1
MVYVLLLSPPSPPSPPSCSWSAGTGVASAGERPNACRPWAMTGLKTADLDELDDEVLPGQHIVGDRS